LPQLHHEPPTDREATDGLRADLTMGKTSTEGLAVKELLGDREGRGVAEEEEEASRMFQQHSHQINNRIQIPGVLLGYLQEAPSVVA
jgi:hypothetical protein